MLKSQRKTELINDKKLLHQFPNVLSVQKDFDVTGILNPDDRLLRRTLHRSVCCSAAKRKFRTRKKIQYGNPEFLATAYCCS